MRFMLDTSALLAHNRRESGATTVQAIFEDGDADIFLASPSLAEFARRLHDLGMDDPTVRETLDNYILLFTEIVPISATAAIGAYLIGRQTEQPLPLIDALIAAAAQSRDAVLVHRDAHMAAIPGDVIQQQRLD